MWRWTFVVLNLPDGIDEEKKEKKKNKKIILQVVKKSSLLFSFEFRFFNF